MKKKYVTPKVIAIDFTSDGGILQSSSNEPSRQSVSVDYEKGVWQGEVKDCNRGSDIWE